MHRRLGQRLDNTNNSISSNELLAFEEAPIRSMGTAAEAFRPCNLPTPGGNINALVPMHSNRFCHSHWAVGGKSITDCIDNSNKTRSIRTQYSNNNNNNIRRTINYREVTRNRPCLRRMPVPHPATFAILVSRKVHTAHPKDRPAAAAAGWRALVTWAVVVHLLPRVAAMHVQPRKY
jgi:hypothetical protein